MPTQAPEAISLPGAFAFEAHHQHQRPSRHHWSGLPACRPCLAIAAGLKLFGLIAVRGSVIDLAAVAIALAHVR